MSQGDGKSQLPSLPCGQPLAQAHRGERGGCEKDPTPLQGGGKTNI